MTTIGLISDTHGLISQEAIIALQGVDLILHAGDIGKGSIIETLQEIAPVISVRGNCDKDKWALQFPETRVIKIEDVVIYLLHDQKRLDLDPVAAGFQVFVSGHSHQPLIEKKPGVIFINPGSAGPKRFKLPD